MATTITPSQPSNEVTKLSESLGDDDVVHQLGFQQQVSQLLSPFFQDNKRKMVQEFLNSSVLISPRKLRKEGEKLPHQLHTIQVQASLRVAVWGCAGPHFIEQFSKIIVARKTKRRKKKRPSKQDTKNSPDKIVLDELISVLQLGAFLLGPQTSFSSFLQQCISRQSYEAIPQLKSIFQHFEIPCPYEEHEPLPLRPLQPSHKKPSLPAQPAVPAKEKKKDPSLLDQSNVRLTAPLRRKGNSLLRGTDKSRYVGSHFNSNLSNVQSLFRQTTSAPRKRTPSSTTPALLQRKKPKRTLVVPPTPCCAPPQEKRLSPGSLIAQAFQSIDQKGRRCRRRI